MPGITTTRRLLPRPRLLCAVLFPALCCFSAYGAEELEFDSAALAARGIDPKLAALFKNAPRFLPGATTVALRVNGAERGRVRVTFDEQGDPCIDRTFLKAAGLLVPRGVSDDGCFDLKSAWQQAEISADPGEERLSLLVPQQALAAPDQHDSWQHGGAAGMLSYDAQYLDSIGKNAGLNFMQVGLEGGFNVSDWIVRSRQTVSRFNGEVSLNHQGAYAQRSFTQTKQVLQVGQINLQNSLFGTGQVLGVQLFPELGLEKRGGAGLVEGIANSASVVEVRQAGVLVYSTSVPAGPFKLQGFSLLNTRNDLQVTLTDTQGNKQEFVVPAASLPMSSGSAPGLSIGVGKMTQLAGNAGSPWVATLSRGWELNARNIFTAGLMTTAQWRTAAISLNSQPFNRTQTQLQITASQDARHGDRGVSVYSAVSQKVSERISLSLNASTQSKGYSDMGDAQQEERRKRDYSSRDQIGAGISWAGGDVGTFSLGWARSRTFNGDSISYLRGGWSKSFDRAYLSLNVERSGGGRNNTPEQRVYMALNVPFGDSKTVSSYLNHSDKNGARAGARYNDRLSQDRSWSLSAERDFRQQRDSLSAGMDMVTPVSQLSGSLSRYAEDSTSWSLRASGGAVVHGGGVTLSPYRIGDTFGIAKVGDERGVRLDTPGGPTWTDGRGYAVIPSLSSYRRSQVQIDARSLKKNVDIANGVQETSAARGSVSYLAFDIVRSRRVLVDVKDNVGKVLPYGASVFDAKDNFVTAVGSDGSIFISDAGDGGRMEVQLGGKTICSFDLKLPAKPQDAGLFENASAQCS
ncbi:fimbria/pilus outer membrane usher protein [Pantoea dispersa]|uniref:fimbria/pilus outer membrane usher protein n=1 Tax=Pantoea dispersa TaxID=59814 RepID=UPI0023AA16F0|nr:fimbria/pilus outer membrane usher protein [Pantoea dispersa]WEA06019.1 fimbria/pilus outer membrane usher protein [Pantoea dispersa]